MDEVTDNKRPLFGNRHLTKEKDVFSHNAWDDVEWDEEQEAQAKASVAANSKIKLTSDEILELEKKAGSHWDSFYGIHQNRFFKDRNWLFTEFPELNNLKDNEPEMDMNILEMGCGVGNSVFPILESNTYPHLKMYCCDFSSTAIEILKENEKYTSDPRVKAFVCDLTDSISWINNAPFQESSLDIILAIFVLSALDPKTMDTAVKNISKYLKPGGIVAFRDYGRYDLAQLRFKDGKCLGDDFYMRGDRTRCYFFTREYLTELFAKNGFEVLECKYDRRLQVNRGKQLKMYRVWVQAKFKKK
ncbi:Uncharacterized methyltransferase-like protein SPBC21C3.07c,O-methyltransferase 3,Methyltransferase-like protein 6,Methyltransferase-like protein 2-A,Methyltransferase-like protein 2,Methyltransferase-like protein,tRNA(Thr) (cytosine(32)-N(3))-methyltransferase,Methyltransferase-like protein 2A,Methyltransferase-like protein 2B [Lepeophtheirus salmonis]|uniref:tRNA N(3)-methylcytidine methyltransferase n=1 Tax=Lepeophtheirus salmonis TaxID=72036 RepID=A0A7R8H1B3_LEPSM|nr:Uncharacterized methyltransferase-like protein SPBC21C3.07c,O-methyltransferase 3,Methyltransferase-like protein 6,Methyltransferase-like protein 2-A,Methyltransferase-like protein 2,Methyltransferase-like protein,tRNA(Thr) (cytosine(32)-N(3))-methyltransferase,Methyltransferase-like protein 2A,Methyltransferase-like protein 2B [Lepeophtheirus salmonis]CAF2791134.1 Uncharacterized methyltransferase-like protein SPBC21C3.07c,O-methyltransferase 3,Methyltransferase-like protein 6,Methyltransferas